MSPLARQAAGILTPLLPSPQRRSSVSLQDVEAAIDRVGELRADTASEVAMIGQVRYVLRSLRSFAAID